MKEKNGFDVELRELSDNEKKIIESNINTSIFLSRNGAVVPFDFSTNHANTLLKIEEKKNASEQSEQVPH